MDKLLVNKYQDSILFNEETNSIVELPSDIDCRTCFVAQNDGQVISTTEVVDYKAGDVIFILSFYEEITKQWLNKIIVSNDVVAKDDIIEWYNSPKKKDETI